VNDVNIIASAEQQVQNQLQYELITKLETFIRDSIQFYKKPNKDKCLALINNYKELQTLFRINNICQIKLFLNLLYYLIRNQPPQDSLYSKIEQAIKCWPSQGPFIKRYYEFTKYQGEPIRNLLLDERFQTEALTDNECGKLRSNLKIPLFVFFFYETIPTWDTFAEHFYQKPKKFKQKYPYINFFTESDKYELYGKELKSKEIESILSAKDKKKYSGKSFYDFKYYNFKSLNELSAFYSKSYIFYQKECNTHLGYKLDFDFDSIEKELSSIELAVMKG
jgi:hypothetical protein